MTQLKHLYVTQVKTVLGNAVGMAGRRAERGVVG